MHAPRHRRLRACATYPKSRLAAGSKLSDGEPSCRERLHFRERRASPRRRGALVLVRRNVIMITATNAEMSVPNDRREEEASAPAYQAFQLLHLGLVAAPIIMGADKFLNLLTNWEKYLAP